MTDRYHSASGERGKAGKAPPPRSYSAVPSPRVKAANNSYPSIEGGYQVPHSAGVARSSKEQEQGEEDRVEIEVKDRGGEGTLLLSLLGPVATVWGQYLYIVVAVRAQRESLAAIRVIESSIRHLVPS